MPLDPHLLQLYLVAAVALVLVPGPDTLNVLAAGIGGGRPAGAAAALAVAGGNLVHASAAALGLSAVLAASAPLFEAIRWAGAAYLIWLGLHALAAAAQNWRTGIVSAERSLTNASTVTPGGAARSALLTNLLNPKIILFQLAFVPQFVNPGLGAVPAQLWMLGAILAALGLAYQLGLAAVAAAARAMLLRPRVRSTLDGMTGLLFLGFATRLLLTQRATT